MPRPGLLRRPLAIHLLGLRLQWGGDEENEKTSKTGANSQDKQILEIPQEGDTYLKHISDLQLTTYKNERTQQTPSLRNTFRHTLTYYAFKKSWKSPPLHPTWASLLFTVAPPPTPTEQQSSSHPTSALSQNSFPTHTRKVPSLPSKSLSLDTLRLHSSAFTRHTTPLSHEKWNASSTHC